MRESLSKPPTFDGFNDLNLAEIDLEKIDPTDHLSIYLKQAAKLGTTLLTLGQELQLGEKIQNGLTIKNPDKPKVYDNVNLTDEAKEAFKLLVDKNLKLVVYFAKQFKGRGVELADLIQFGNNGLMTSAIKYDPERKKRFSTHASIWIKQALFRCIDNFGRTITLPGYINDDIYSVKKTTDELTQILKRKPEIGEMAEKTGFDNAYLEHLHKVNMRSTTISLNEPLKDSDKDSELGDFIVGSGDEFVEDILEDLERPKFIEFIYKLSENGKIEKRSLFILLYRTGNIDGKTHTLKETGKLFDLTGERIRQLQSRVITRIRRYITERKTDHFKNVL